MTKFLFGFLTVLTSFTALSQPYVNDIFNMAIQGNDSTVILYKNYLEQSDDLDSNFRAESYLGVYYDIKGLPEQGQIHLINSIQHQKNSKDYSGLAFSYNNLGLLYYNINDYENAIKYIYQALNEYQKAKDVKRQIDARANLAVMYTYTGKLDSAKIMQEANLNEYYVLNDSAGISRTYSNLAKLDYKAESFDSMLVKLNTGLQYIPESVDPNVRVAFYISLSNAYRSLQEPDSNIYYAHLALLTAQKINSPHRRLYAYKEISEAYAANNDYKNAYEYTQLFIGLKDSIINNERDAKLIELETKFNLAETQMDKIRSERKFENLVLWIGSIGFIILFVILFLLYKNRNKQKVNQLLIDKNKLNQTLIDQKQLHLSETNHRVKNNLQLIQSLIRMQKRGISDEGTQTILTEIQNKIRAISVVHELAIENDEENLNLKQYLSKISESIQVSSPMPFEIQLQCDKSIELSPNQLQTIGLLINEILTNSIKYARPSSGKSLTSTIRIYKSENSTVIEASDNGLPQGTTSVSGKGTLLVDGLVQQLNGNYTVDSEQGFKYIISFT